MQNIKYITKVTLFALMLVGLASCEDSFLEIVPKESLIIEKTSDYELLLNNKAMQYGFSEAPILMSDDLVSVESFFKGEAARVQRIFNWEDDINEADGDGKEMGQLRTLYTFNKIINEVMSSVGGTEAEKKTIMAEARAQRAFIHFYFVNLYGKPYNEATADTDLGFPIITEADLTNSNYRRASVKEVYAFVIDELTATLPDVPNFHHRFRMSKSSIRLMLGKAYMYMGKFEEALPFLVAASSNGTPENPIRLVNYNTALYAGGEYFPIGVFGPKMPLGPYRTEVFYAKWVMCYNAFTKSSIVPSPEAMALFDPTDERLKFYSTLPYGSSVPIVAGLSRKAGMYSPHVGLTLPNLYLLRAECKARLNDLSGAVTDVEFLREHRMPEAIAAVPAGIASDRLSLLNFIIDERRREFLLQDKRWYDMRRFSVDPLFSGATYTRTSYDASGNPHTTVTMDPKRLTMRLPQKVVAQNPGMVNNE